jgi:hypothetical protein
MRRLAALAVLAVATAISVGTVHAMTIDCHYTGPVMNNPGMEYICYVH